MRKQIIQQFGDAAVRKKFLISAKPGQAKRLTGVLPVNLEELQEDTSSLPGSFVHEPGKRIRLWQPPLTSRLSWLRGGGGVRPAASASAPSLSTRLPAWFPERRC